jgi:tRNA (cmo5U34)-methyltransferase
MKNNPSAIDHFNDAAKQYDERNRQLAPIMNNLHFLIRLILKNIPDRARVLCVGVGTGTEILSLSETFTEWRFVGVDPSIGMINVCREKLKIAGILDRCELINGSVNDVPEGEKFDSVLSILVGHFVKLEDRLHFYTAMCDRLNQNGFLINTEISYDLNSQHFPLMLKNWEAIQSLMGATPESLENLSTQLREMLTVMSPSEIEIFLNQSGIHVPVRFYQAFMIHGWYGIKK